MALQKCREEPTSSSTGFVALSYSWREHPERPHPFCVIDQQKIPEEEKLACAPGAWRWGRLAGLRTKVA